jgi:hypothetical protein
MPHKDVEDGVASLVFVAGISIKRRHACLGEAAVRRRILEERLTAGPCHSGEPNRETTAGRDPLRRHAHFFAAAALSYYPSTRLHLVDAAINGTTCLAWSKGSTDKSARIAVLSGQGLPTPPQTDDRLVHLVKDTRNDPAAVEADQVYAGRDESGHGHQCRPRLGQPRFAVVDLRPPLNTKSEHKK